MTGGLRMAGITGSKVMEVVTQFDRSGPLAMIGDENLLRIATRFYNHPTGDTDIEQEQPTVDLLTDTWFGSFDQKSVELMSAHTRNVYNYYLTQQTNNSLIAPMFNLPVEYTPMHGDDLAFLISGNKLEDTTNLSEEERETARLMIKYWSNFAKYGNPSPVGSFDVPTWYPVTPDRMVKFTSHGDEVSSRDSSTFIFFNPIFQFYSEKFNLLIRLETSPSRDLKLKRLQSNKRYYIYRVSQKKVYSDTGLDSKPITSLLY